MRRELDEFCNLKLLILPRSGGSRDRHWDRNALHEEWARKRANDEQMKREMTLEKHITTLLNEFKMWDKEEEEDPEQVTGPKNGSGQLAPRFGSTRITSLRNSRWRMIQILHHSPRQVPVFTSWISPLNQSLSYVYRFPARLEKFLSNQLRISDLGYVNN